MKKTLIASAMVFGSLASINVNAASIEVTNMVFYNDPGFVETMAATGTLYDVGGGSVDGIDPFLGNAWNMSQETMFMNNTGLWSGSTGDISSPDDVFDYNDEIAAMTNEQIAVGLFFNWNTFTTTAVLAVFDCTGSGTVENPLLDCVASNAVALDNGVFKGSFITVNAVPVPAAAWLMGSGLIGLAGVARRRKTA